MRKSITRVLLAANIVLAGGVCFAAVKMVEVKREQLTETHHVQAQTVPQLVAE